MGEKNRLSQTELQFMKILWDHPEGISSGEIYALFPQALSTKSTILRRILKKGHAQCIQKGKQVYYYPTATKQQYEKAMFEEKMKKQMGYGSLSELVAAFCGKQELTKEQSKELEKLIDNLEHSE